MCRGGLSVGAALLDLAVISMKGSWCCAAGPGCHQHEGGGPSVGAALLDAAVISMRAQGEVRGGAFRWSGFMGAQGDMIV